MVTATASRRRRKPREIALPYRPSPDGLLARIRAAYHPGMRGLLDALPDKPRARLEHDAILAAGAAATPRDVERLVVVEDTDTGWVGIASSWQYGEAW